MSNRTRKPQQAVKTTIVGGQPPGNTRDLPPIPVGLEELLGMAAAETAFADLLARDPDAAIEASGQTVSPTERAILKAIPGPALGQMIDQVRDSLPEPERRAFLEQAGAALVLGVGAAGVAGAGCKENPRTTPRTGPSRSPAAGETGARPDRPAPDASVKKRPSPTRGIRPDRPRPKHYDPRNDTSTTGVRPDRPGNPTGSGSKPDK